MSQHDVSLHWRHTDHDGVSNHQHHGRLLNRLFGRRSKKTSKLRVTGLCVGNSPVPVNSPHKWPVTRKLFPFDDVIMFYKIILLTNSTHCTSLKNVHTLAFCCVFLWFLTRWYYLNSSGCGWGNDVTGPVNQPLTPSQNLNQCWLITKVVLWHSITWEQFHKRSWA